MSRQGCRGLGTLSGVESLPRMTGSVCFCAGVFSEKVGPLTMQGYRRPRDSAKPARADRARNRLPAAFRTTLWPHFARQQFLRELYYGSRI